MPDKSQIAAASRTLSSHWHAGTKLGGLEPAQRPRDRRAGYAIQAGIAHTSAADVFGWKIAATSAAGRKHINVEGPMAGRILKETVLPDGGTAPMAGNDMRVAEPEFAFRMRADLPPRRVFVHCERGARRSRHIASRDRNSGLAVFRFRQRWRSADHRRQCLRPFVCSG